MNRILPYTVLVALLAASCARDPVTGKRELVLVSEAQEVAMGREAAVGIDAEMGLYPDEALQRYVDRLGQSLAAASERPMLPWRFAIVDSPVVNAFALPGGYIYLTRGILTYMNSEAELLGVLGHEIGHVTARHSVEQISRQQLAGLGLGLGGVFFPEVRPFGDVLGGGLGLLFLKFGRDAERESDRLGVRYTLAQGYDAKEMAGFFSVLGRLSGPERDIPSWASTHPDPEEREAGILRLVAEQSAANSLKVGADSYKRTIEGIVFGENPREGFMKGDRFLHPELKFQIELPAGWRVRNTRQVLFAAPADGAAALQLTASRVPSGTTPGAHARNFFAANRLEYGTGQRIRVSSFAAYQAPFRARTQGGELVGQAGFVLDGDLVYEILGITRPNAFRRYTPVFRAVLSSFDRLRDRSALEIQPLRIRLFEVPERMTFGEALRRSGADPEHVDELALLNDLALDEELAPGTLVKVLERGEP